MSKFKKGEMIEVKNGGVWLPREFLAIDDTGHVCRSIMNDNSFHAYHEARKLEIDTTITFKDGKEIELSLESYKAMRGEG